MEKRHEIVSAKLAKKSGAALSETFQIALATIHDLGKSCLTSERMILWKLCVYEYGIIYCNICNNLFIDGFCKLFLARSKNKPVVVFFSITKKIGELKKLREFQFLNNNMNETIFYLKDEHSQAKDPIILETVDANVILV